VIPTFCNRQTFYEFFTTEGHRPMLVTCALRVVFLMIFLSVENNIFNCKTCM